MDLPAAERWVDERLSDASLRRSGPLALFRTRPWADIFVAPTDGGPVWLKVPGPTTRFEVGLYAVLARTVPEAIVPPLGIDAQRGWLLLPDAGPALGGDYDDVATDDFANAMARYGVSQIALAEHVDALLGVGVADMRPAAMAARFDEAMAAGRRYVAASCIPPHGPSTPRSFGSRCRARDTDRRSARGPARAGT